MEGFLISAINEKVEPLKEKISLPSRGGGGTTGSSGVNLHSGGGESKKSGRHQEKNPVQSGGGWGDEYGEGDTREKKRKLFPGAASGK